MNFEYSVIRVVPSTIAEESLNVGILVKAGEHVQLCRAHGLARITTAFPAVNESDVETGLAYLDELGQTSPDLDLLSLSRTTRGALVQVSPPACTLGDSLEHEIEGLFELYVEPKAVSNGVYHATSAPRRGRPAAARR